MNQRMASSSGRVRHLLAVLRRRPGAVAGCVVLVLLALITTVLLPYGLRWYNVQDLDHAVRHPPSLTPVTPYEKYTQPHLVGTHTLAIEPPQYAYRLISLFGHDALGRSTLYRMVPAFAISMGVGLAAAIMAVVVGVLWGTIAALAGGWCDMVMMRVVDVLYSLPYVLTVVLLKISLTPPLMYLLGFYGDAANVVVLIVAVGGVSWLTMARIVRSTVLSLQHRPFVEAARLAGAGHVWVFCRHLWPQLTGLVVVQATLVIPQAVLQESFLSFLGIGIQQPVPSLGRLAAEGLESVNTFVGYWWLMFFPCATLAVTLLSFNLLGDGLRDALDPAASKGVLV